MKRVPALLIALLLLAGCAQIQPSPDAAQDVADRITPAPTATPAPTPEPELTTLEQAFLHAQKLIPGLPMPEDPQTVFPQGNRQLLSSIDLDSMTPYELEWGWREIVTRAGFESFKSHDFTEREWYDPDPDFERENLTQTEAMNCINIRNAALVHYSSMKTVKNNRASADLNGDGRNEGFSFSADRFSGQGILQIASTRYTIELPQLDGRIYLCDIDIKDGLMELAIPFTRVGGDYRIAFFRYHDGNLILLGELQGDRTTLRLYGDGTLNAYQIAEDGLYPYRYPQKYYLIEDTLRPAARGIRPIRQLAYLLEPLPLKDENDSSFSISAGEAVQLICVTPQGEYILRHIQSQRLGVFTLTDGVITSSGLSAQEQFDGLPLFP